MTAIHSQINNAIINSTQLGQFGGSNVQSAGSYPNNQQFNMNALSNQPSNPNLLNNNLNQTNLAYNQNQSSNFG